MTKEVYMSIELGQLKSILETATKLQNGEIKDLRTLNSVIQRYSQIAQNIGNTQELPAISPYDENLDIDFLLTSFTTSGTSKLTNIITYAEGYINAHTPIPPTEVKGWKKANVIGIIAIIIAVSIYAANQAYQTGVSNGRSETQRGYDAEKISLSQKLDSLKTNYNIINDSLKVCNANVIAKNDSISLLLSKNKQVNNNKKGSAK